MHLDYHVDIKNDHENNLHEYKQEYGLMYYKVEHIFQKYVQYDTFF